jgi:hypothetical protein
MKFILKKDTLIIEDAEVINSGSVNYYEADVEYDDSWNNLIIEAKIVEKGSEIGTPKGVVNKKVFIDVEKDCRYCIGFVGYRIQDEKKVYQISTNLKPLFPEKGAGQIKTSVSDLPTPTEWELYLAQIQELINDTADKISGTIFDDLLEEIQPVLDDNLRQAKEYSDNTKPTKTSELTNDSNFAKTNENNNFSTAQTINGTLTINGDIVQNGESYESHAEKVYTKKDEIILREGAEGGMSADQFAGLIALLYNGIASGRLGFKADGTAYVGDVGDEQPLLTRDDVLNLQDGQVLIWDGTKLRAIGSSDFIKNTDIAQREGDYGLVKLGTTANGISVDKNGILYSVGARDDEIQSEAASSYRNLQPRNISLIIKTGMTKNQLEWTDEEKTSARNLLNTIGINDYSSETKAGILKAWTSTNEDGEIGLNISTEV